MTYHVEIDTRAARANALLERLEDAEDRLAIHERENVTMDYDKLEAELGLSG